MERCRNSEVVLVRRTPARVDLLGAHLPDFCHGQHSGEDAKRPVGVAGHGAHVVMKGGGIGPADIGNPALAESGKDAFLR